ncbi:hypothetical protein AB6A40_002591 [Gnathostoma spinigerum]|uniref:Dihydrolipoamide acetyltransferase component of pyruvate dehydrogenase complex n=1 Tax=Gnathostoma spinigerum TaxID=75299 RepID=A0ABD6E989_9BILA
MVPVFLRHFIIRSVRNSLALRHVHVSRAWYLPTIQFKLSDIGEGIAEVQVKEWHVKEGDHVAQFDDLCDVQSDKASVTITSRYDGIIKKLHYNVDDIAKVGSALLDIEISEEGSDEHEVSASAAKEVVKEDLAKEESVSQAEHVEGVANRVLATPAVRRIAMENKVDLSKVRGTGKDGRIQKEDVLHFIEESQRSKEPVRRPAPIITTPSAPKKTFEALKQDQVVPIRGYTRAMIKSMSEALKIPHFGFDDEFCVDRLISMREQLKPLAKEKGIKLSYMPMFIKAASLALLQFPMLNAVVDDKMENLVHKASHNICVAMDTPDGLVVPNIKNCEQRTMWEIAEELNRLSELGQRGQIRKEDLIDGTFTLSNIGMVGGTYVRPIIFPPQVVIGAITKIEKLPRFNHDGQVYPANIVKLSWAADHRVIDGATVARFSNAIKRYIEEPSLMAAEMR